MKPSGRGKQLRWHTHIHEFHTGTRLRKYKIIGRWVQDHAHRKTEYHVRTWDSIIWLSFGGVKKACGSMKMSRFKFVMNGVRLEDKRLSDSVGSHTVWALSFGVLVSVLKSMCDVYVRVFEWGFLVYITCFMACMCLQIRKQGRLWHQRLFFSSVLSPSGMPGANARTFSFFSVCKHSYVIVRLRMIYERQIGFLKLSPSVQNEQLTF